MTEAVAIRRAERRDAAELAILVDISSHGFALWLWHGAVPEGTAQTALEHGRQMMRLDDERAGWKDASVALVDDDVAGAVIGHVLDPSIASEKASHPALEPILTLQKQVIGNWFVDSLGVYRRHRGRGIGRQLLDHEIARASGLPISLITESDNDVALNLYRSSGFKDMARSASIPLDENSKKHDWVLLTRSAT